MKTETQIINGYWDLLNTLTPNLKQKLMEKLSKSIDKEIVTKNERFEKSFGAWIDSRDSDEIISEIRSSRTLTRHIETF
jgi:hypothetical protein